MTSRDKHHSWSWTSRKSLGGQLDDGRAGTASERLGHSVLGGANTGNRGAIAAAATTLHETWSGHDELDMLAAAARGNRRGLGRRGEGRAALGAWRTSAHVAEKDAKHTTHQPPPSLRSRSHHFCLLAEAPSSLMLPFPRAVMPAPIATQHRGGDADRATAPRQHATERS